MEEGLAVAGSAADKFTVVPESAGLNATELNGQTPMNHLLFGALRLGGMAHAAGAAMKASRSQIRVIAYDSPSNKRRRKLATLLEGYGVRVQHSMFECQLRPETVAQLQRRLQKLIRPEEDRVRLWPLSARCCARIVNLGIPVPAPGLFDIVI